MYVKTAAAVVKTNMALHHLRVLHCHCYRVGKAKTVHDDLYMVSCTEAGIK